MTATPEVPPQSGRIEQALRRETTVSGQIAILEAELGPRIRGDGPLDWIFLLAEIAARAELPLEVIRLTASALAWRARDAGQRIPAENDHLSCADHPYPETARRVVAYAHGARLRFDFKFDELDEWCTRWLQDLRDDAYLVSFAAFAALGLRSERGRPLIERALRLPDVDSGCRSACLHALWFAIDLADQAERIMALSEEMIGRGEESGNLYFWRCFALRRLGRLDEALASVDRAMALLPAGMNQVHQDYVRERELIKTTQLLEEQMKRAADEISARLRAESEAYADEVRRDLARYSESGQKIVSESLVKVVEVLGVFVAFAGFLLGSGVLLVRPGAFWQHAGGIALLLTGTLLFFVVLRAVVRADPAARPRRRRG
jgi:tetratricopeptide (TPR) repeat protein